MNNSMSAQHTQGPWAVEETPNSSNQNYVVKVGRCRVSVYTDNDEADAHLIAAAPDMLDALRDAATLLNAIAPLMERQGSHDYRHGANLVAAAIAKATGNAAGSAA